MKQYIKPMIFFNKVFLNRYVKHNWFILMKSEIHNQKYQRHRTWAFFQPWTEMFWNDQK